MQKDREQRRRTLNSLCWPPAREVPGSQGRFLGAKTEVEPYKYVFAGLFSMACFLVEPRTVFPGTPTGQSDGDNSLVQLPLHR